MKYKYAFAALVAFAFMFASPAWALPGPTSENITFDKGAKFTVAGYTNATGIARERLLNFPVLVRIAENSPLGFSYNDLMSKTTGADIAFVDMNGNGLPFEIDTWNTNGTSLIWVRLPSMRNRTEFVMCWGGVTSGKTVCGDNPFAEYKGVWHMNEKNVVDASGSRNNGTAVGSPIIVSGKIGSALSLPTTSDYVTCSTNLPNPQLASGFTVEGWANSSNLSGNHALFGKKQFISVRTESSESIKVTTPAVTDHNGVSVSLSTDTWFHWAMTFVPGDNGLNFYVDGELKNTQKASGFKDSMGSTEMWLGHNEWGGQEFLGNLDEMRLSADIKSADWIAATYATQSDAEFLSAGEAQDYEASAEPQVGVVASDVQYTNATLSVSIGSLGMDAGKTTAADWTDLLLVVGTEETLSSPPFVVPLSRATEAPMQILASLAGLNAETVYYAQLRATNSLGVASESLVVSFTTLPPGPAFTATIDSDHLVPAIALSFSRTGQASSVTQITVQVSSTGDFDNPDVSKTMEVDLSEMPVRIDGIDLVGLPTSSTLSYRFIAENSEGFSTVVDASAPSTIGDGNNVWSGLSEDIDDPNAYVFVGGLPEPDKTLYFTKPAGLSPVINQDTEMPSLRFTVNTASDPDYDSNYRDGFHSFGYDLSGTGTLSFTAERPIIHATKGTNIVRNPLLFNRTNSQTVYLIGRRGRLDLTGELGVSNTTMRVNGEGGEVHFGGPSPDFMGKLYLESSVTLSLDHPDAMTNMNHVFFGGGWGSFTYLKNNTGAPMTFPRCTKVETTTDWSSTRACFSGAPMFFPDAILIWYVRAFDGSTFDADVFVKDLEVGKNSQGGDAGLDKRGTGTLAVSGTTSWSAQDVKHYIRLRGGCFYPQTSAGLPPSGEFYVPVKNEYGTLGLGDDYIPMLDGSSTPRVFQETSESVWGFTGFGGDRTVCWNADPTLNLTNTTSNAVSTKLADSSSVNSVGKTYNTYYAYPSRLMFGNRSEYADGTIIFMNPIRYELRQNWDTTTYFESTNHIVAARMRGSLKLGNSSKKWNFSGRNFGGYLALEAENTDFTGNVNVYEKGNLLVNSNLVAQSATVQSGSGLGGTGSLSTVGGTTVKSGGALFGGEWNKGGTLTIGGKLTFEGGSSLRVEAGASDDCRGCVKLAADSTLKLTAPIYVDVDTDPRVSPVRGASRKVLDWSEASFDSGSAPTRENFVVRPERNADLKKISVSVRDDGLYVGYTSVRCPMQMIIIVR